MASITFAGGGEALQAVMSGTVQLSSGVLAPALPQIKAGAIKGLAVTGARRSPFDPDIPTIAEQGYLGYAATNWYAIVVSSKTPPEIVTALHGIITKALTAPEVKDAYAKQGIETVASTQAEAAVHIARETEIWKKVIADAGIRLE